MRKNVVRATLVVACAILLWFGFGLISAQRACAHDPRFACSPRPAQSSVRVPDASKSWAYYGRLVPGQSDTYTFEVPRQLGVPMSLLIEAADAGDPARPQAIVKNAAGATVATLDLHQHEPMYEPFSGINYLTTPDHRFVLAPGHYTATVTMNGGLQPQRYVFAIGEAEKFGIGEIPYVLGAVYRVKTRGY